MQARLLGRTIDDFYARCLHRGDLAFDVGANMGEHTAAMLRAGATVVAVEPQIALAGRLVHAVDATVVHAAVGDRPGEAMLMKAGAMTGLATLNPDWPSSYGEKVRSVGWEPAEWDGRESVRVTTLNALISEHGRPMLVKIDVEGLEDRVLSGLSEPVPHLLFEVHSGMPRVARRALERLASLGRYELRVMEYEDWTFGPVVTPEALMARLPDYGDVHASLIHQ